MIEMEIPRIHRLGLQLRRLTGTRCVNCSERLIGPRSICSACGGTNVQPVEFANTGHLVTFTEIFNPPSGYEAVAPYFIGLVQLDNGPRVLAQLTDVNQQEVRIGMRVEMVFRRLLVDGDAGPILYGYKFRPTFYNNIQL